jgi:hypothetical protein
MDIVTQELQQHVKGMLKLLSQETISLNDWNGIRLRAKEALKLANRKRFDEIRRLAGNNKIQQKPALKRSVPK